MVSNLYAYQLLPTTFEGVRSRASEAPEGESMRSVRGLVNLLLSVEFTTLDGHDKCSPQDHWLKAINEVADMPVKLTKIQANHFRNF